MSTSPRSGRRPGLPASRNRGFTLIEVLIGIVLSSIIGGVIVGALITSTNIAEISTGQVNESTDAGLIAAFLTRDAQAAGGVDPTTGIVSSSIGVATAASGANWAKCEQEGEFVARFSWIDRQSASARRSVVATYALVERQLVRRVCQDDVASSSVIGADVAAAIASCLPDPGCGVTTTAVTLDVTGSSVDDPFVYRLQAELRRDNPTAPTSSSAAPVPLLALGDPSPSLGCPVLSLSGTAIVKVLGDVLASSLCGSAPIAGDMTLLRPTGSTATTPSVVDPLSTVASPTFSCSAAMNPTSIGVSASPNAVVVYPQRVTISSTVAFQPGQYVFCNGFELAAGADVSGRDLTLVMLGTASVIDPTAIVNLSAPTTGSTANVVLWVMSAQSLTIPGGIIAGSYRGIVYAPTSVVTIAGGVGVNLGGLIAKVVLVGGTGAVRVGLPIPSVVVTPTSLAGGQSGVAYPATAFAASGGSAPYGYVASGLPAGLSLTTGGMLTGTPTQFGSFTVFVTATDATAASATTRLTLTINAPLAFAAPATLSNGQVGLVYPTASASTTGGTAPIAWSAAGLPAGLTMSPAGQLAGSPTAAGSFTVMVTARDALGATVNRSLSLSIAARLSIAAPATLPAGRVGEAYPATTVTTSGGTGAVTWSALGLPAGLSINPTTGTVSGSPTSAGAYSVTIAAADAAGATATSVYPLTITSIVPAGCSATTAGWRGEYFSNINLTGPNTVCRDDAAINFDWAYGSPDPAVRTSDNFSVRWTRTVDFVAGDYLFTLGSDDGGRLYVDGVLVIDRWVDQAYPPAPPTYTGTLAAGPHTIVVEYYERGGYAKAVMNWKLFTPVICPGSAGGWIGQYYSTTNLTGSMVLCRDDAAVNFNWGSGSPAPEVPADRFSVRWTRQQSFNAGTYTFRMGTDDGGRLYIDGVLVLDRWVDQAYPRTIPAVAVQLTAGTHTIVMEYYENGGAAAATLTWS